MLHIENLSFSIGQETILQNINLSFARGQLHAIIGPNGSGKSTLLKNICRLWKPHCGYIAIDGEKICELPRKTLSQKVTFVPQNTWLTYPISVNDLVMMGRNPHSKMWQGKTLQDKKIVEEAMAAVEVDSLASRLVTQISGGQRQRAWIACALATQAPLMLLDEPTSALDIKHKLKVLRLLSNFRNRGLTIVVVIHELSYAYNFFDTVTIMDKGMVQASGPTVEIMQQETIRQVFGVNTHYLTYNENTILHFS